MLTQKTEVKFVAVEQSHGDKKELDEHDMVHAGALSGQEEELRLVHEKTKTIRKEQQKRCE